MSYEYEKVLTPSTGLRLHLNENTAGCSPKVLDALRGLTTTDISFYPDYDDVIGACAKALGVEDDQLVLTNGLDEGILAITIAALRERDSELPEAIVVVPAFDMYAATAAAVGARVVELPLEPDFRFPADSIRAAINPRTRLLFLTSPNNPTGLSIPRSEIVRIAREAPHVKVLIDEAYADFSGVTLLNDREAATLPNLYIGRTFAKAYGLAGVRVGAVIGTADSIKHLRHIVPPFSLNICASVALKAGLADVEYYRWYLEEVQASKALLYQALEKAGVRYWPSDANFVLAEFGARAPAVVDGLAKRGVHVRDKSRDPACPGCVRITTGVVEHTRACVQALEEVLCGEA